MYVNDVIPIRWLSSPGNYIDIYLTINGGLDWEQLNTPGSPLPSAQNGMGEYSWTIPASILQGQRISDNCYLKIINTQQEPHDIGISRKFTISMGDIIVGDPVGGRDGLLYMTNCGIKIEWEAFGQIPDVGIYYSLDDKVTWHEIVTGEPNTTTPNKGTINSYVWSVPKDFTEKTDCWIRVNSLDFFETINDTGNDPIRFLKWRSFIRKENMGL